MGEQLPAQLKALALKAPVAVEEKFPMLVAKLRETKQLALDTWGEVKPTLQAKWAQLATDLAPLKATGPETAKHAAVALPATVWKLGETTKAKVMSLAYSSFAVIKEKLTMSTVEEAKGNHVEAEAEPEEAPKGEAQTPLDANFEEWYAQQCSEQSIVEDDEVDEQEEVRPKLTFE